LRYNSASASVLELLGLIAALLPVTAYGGIAAQSTGGPAGRTFLVKRGNNSASASSSIFRIGLSGWFCGTRCSADM
jgi:hypothetical protein